MLKTCVTTQPIPSLLLITLRHKSHKSPQPPKMLRHSSTAPYGGSKCQNRGTPLNLFLLETQKHVLNISTMAHTQFLLKRFKVYMAYIMGKRRFLFKWLYSVILLFNNKIIIRNFKAQNARSISKIRQIR